MTKFNVKSELEAFYKELSELTDLFNDSKNNINLISNKYSELKFKINDRLKLLENAHRSSSLSQSEVDFLLPAIRDVSLHFVARVGSKNFTLLSSSICDGKDYCTYWLTALEP